MPYTADDLIVSAKRRGAIPAAQATWQPADFLAVADEEILTYCVPILQRVREEYYLQQDEYQGLQNPSPPFSSGQFFRLPDRALGGTTRDVVVLDSNGNPMDIPRITVDDTSMAAWGYFVLGGMIGYINRTQLMTPSKMVITYYLRPSRLGLEASAARVESFVPATKAVTLDSLPTGYDSSITTWDIIRQRPNFEMLRFDEPGSLSGSTITFTNALPTELQIGDWVTIPETTPVPQVPAEFHPLLAQRLAVKFLEAQGRTEELQAALAILSRMETDLTNLITPRFQGEPRKIVPRDNVWRRWRR